MALPPLPAGYTDTSGTAPQAAPPQPKLPPPPVGYAAPKPGGLSLPPPPPGYEVPPNAPGTPIPSTLPKYEGFVDKYSTQFGVDPKAIRTMLGIETAGGRNIADSKAGASGIAQFMPDTAKKYGVDPKNDESGIRGMANYYSDLLKQFHGDKALAATAYNFGPGALQNWLDGKGKLAPEASDYMAKFNRGYYGKDNLEAQQSAQQQEVPSDLAGAAKLSPSKPGPQNPLSFDLFGSKAAVDNVNQKLSVAGAALNTASGAANANVYKPANKAWLGLTKVLQDAAEHPLNTFVNVEGTLMRPAMAIHADINQQMSNNDVSKKLGQSTNAGIRQMYKDNRDAAATIRTAANYFMHPTSMGKVLHSITNPEDTKVLTDTLEKHMANEYGLPDPSKWSPAFKLASDIVTQGSHDPFSYVGVGELAAPIRAGMEVASHATVGMGIAHAVGLSMGKAANTVSKIASKAPYMQDAVNNTGKFVNAAAGFGNVLKKALTVARPDLDAHITPDGKFARFGIEDAADHVHGTLDTKGKDLIAQSGADGKSAFDPIDRDTQHFRLTNVYRFGDDEAAEAAERMGKLVGWKPSVQDMAAKAQGLVQYDPKNLWPRVLSYAVPKDATAPVKNSLEWFKQHKGILDVGKEYPSTEEIKSGADLERMGSATQGDLLRHSFAIEHEAIRNGYVQRQTATLMKENPSFFSEEAMKKVMQNATDRMISGEMGMFGGAQDRVRMAALMEDPEAYTDAFRPYFDDAAMHYAGKEIPNRAPRAMEGSGGWSKVVGALQNVSKAWKSSLAGTGFLVHSIRNVGVIASMVGSSPFVAAKGIMYGLRGVPDTLKNRMQAGGSWSNFWQETPQLLKNLALRTGVGGAMGAWTGEAEAPKDSDPLTRLKDVGVGAAIGAGAGAILPATSRLMDRFENGMRAAHLEGIDRTLGKAETAGDEYARHGKVTQDLGGYTHVTQLVSFLQGIGGTFVAYRAGTVPRAFFDTLVKRTGRIANAERAQQDTAALLPANRGKNPSKAPVELHALGGMDEGINMSIDAVDTVAWAGGLGPGEMDPTGFFTSPATIGQGPATVIKGAKDAYFTKEHPASLSQKAGQVTDTAAGFVPGGSLAQNLTPLNPYKDKTGLPFWQQELMNLMNDYGTSQSLYEQKAERRGYAKAASR